MPPRGRGVEGPRNRASPYWNRMERRGEESETLVRERDEREAGTRSTAGHEEPCGKQGGPPSKAKHYWTTDSGEYREGKVKKNPGRGMKRT